MSSEKLPKNWAQCELFELVDILDSQRVPVNNTDRQARLTKAKTTYPYYGATGQVGEIDDYIFEGESILLGEDGAPFLEPQKPKAYVVHGRYWVNNHAHILRAVGGVKNQFLCHQLNVLDYKPHVSGTTRLKLTQGNLKALPIMVAPLNEQHRIVEKIETLFAQIDKGEEALREVQKLLKRYRQSILKAAVTGELTRDWRKANQHKLEPASDFLARILETRRENWQGRGKYTEPVEPDTATLPILPANWQWASLGQLLHTIEAGKNYRCLERPPEGNEFGIVKISAVTWEDFDEEESKTVTDADRVNPRYLIKKGDLLMSRANTIELVGASVVVDRISKQLQLSDKVLRLKLVVPLEDWVNTVLKSPIGRQQIEAFATGAQMSMRNISQKNIERIAIPLPSQNEVGAIYAAAAGCFEKSRALMSFCATELTRSSTLRQSILKSAFTGQLVPQDPNDEPASELLARIRADA